MRFWCGGGGGKLQLQQVPSPLTSNDDDSMLLTKLMGLIV